jgi:hypothetical protein
MLLFSAQSNSNFISKKSFHFSMSRFQPGKKSYLYILKEWDDLPQFLFGRAGPDLHLKGFLQGFRIKSMG